MNKNSMNQFLEGNYAPIQNESHYQNIRSIIGEIPKELKGVLYRNGPNPQFPDVNKHWFEGDGMLHMFSINNGQISYRNRWIRTEVFKREREAGKMLFSSFNDPAEATTYLGSSSTANTNIIQYGGKLLALEESSCGTEINPLDLSTLGEWDYYGQMQNMSAHPHFDAASGEMHNFAYTPGSNDLTYYQFSLEGLVKKGETIYAPYSSLMHDFFITKDYALFPVHPLTINMNRIEQGKPLLMWEPELGSHLGIMPHKGEAKDIIWMDMNPCHAYHYMNAFQEGNKIILDGMKSDRANLFPDAQGKVADPSEFPPQLTRWTINLDQKKVTEQQLDSVLAEFPRFDERFTGVPYRHGFVAAKVGPESSLFGFDAIIHYDLKNNSQTIREFGEGSMVSEPVFVPRQKNSPEGDGFILSVIYVPERVAVIYIS
ncbi:MAG: carotenoid oxygenase family protein [Tatlockia sp.]|nr:carotenoid oxygenase family protein [Tatlockia sp.]